MRSIFIVTAIVSSIFISGCSNNTKPTDSATPSNAAAKSTAGMNSRGEVINSSKVEAGSGQQVKGLNGTEGEITGKPAAKSKFKKLQIGMSVQQVISTIGQPSDQGAYQTGKAWIPFYFGDDTHRVEAVYQGQGRLIFAGGSVYTGNMGSGTLIWIIHNANESGTR